MDNVQIAEFALETEKDTEDGDYVLRSGKIFEAGNYPDKKFEITEEELAEAAKAFVPVDLDLEHVPTILDGKLGKLEAVVVAKDGRNLIGTARLPKWLDKAIGDGERKVSATWDRVTKRIKKLALVRNPRVSDAALLSAFSAHSIVKAPLEGVISEEALAKIMEKWFEDEKNLSNFVHKTWEGGSAIQSAHDAMSRAGAICNPPADFVSKEESKSIQKIHDMTVEGGAKCNSSGSCMYSDNKENGKMKFTWNDLKKALKIDSEDFDLAANLDENEPEEGKTVENKKDIAGNVAVDATLNESIKEKDAELARAKEVETELRAALAKLTEDSIKAEAEAFANEEISVAKRAYPAEKDAIVSLFVQAAKDDQVLGTKVSFKVGDKETEGSRIDAVKATFAVRKPHDLTVEKLAAMGTKVLDTENGDSVDYIAEAKKQAEEYAESRNQKLKASTASK